ncbi:substrate-binding domain-containing protein [Shimia sp.]|uniref:LacI family DNA-binding transcriptional regulator n=1 Tax=Shimia sp. TaxID=1954381 RepID=UPI003297730D
MNLKKLSQELGLSQTTVSRALNGYPEVNEATRQRVRLAAEKFNYRPNSRAKGLATGRAMMIGHVIPTSTQHEMVNPVFGDFVGGASDAYSQFGYDMMFARVGDLDEANVYRELKAKRSVDGVILQGPLVDDARIPLLNKLGLPYIVHGRSTGISEPYSWVDVNNKRSFQRATEFLIDLGHTRIALVNGLEHMDFARRRREGYVQALKQRGIPIDSALMRSAEMTEVFGHHQTRDMLQGDHPPTAILAASMITAIGVRRAIEEAGLKMGRDISVITHDDDLSYLKNGQDVPIFTATRSSVRKAGEILAGHLIELINEPGRTPIEKMLEAELVVGRSTGPATQGNAT